MKSSKAKEIKKVCSEFGLNKRQYRDYKKVYKSLPQWRRATYIQELRGVLTALREEYGKF
jgi:hypothetical protein